MTDEITSTPAPADTTIPQAPETPIPTASEAVIVQASVEAPTEPVPAPEPIPDEPTAQMGGNEPFAPAPIETQPTPIPAETPTPEVAPTETTQPTPPEPAPVTTATTPAQIVTSVVTPVVAPVIATTITQTFTKSIRELFTRAQLTIQNRKRKKLDRILSLFAKQTMITNNEVEKLLHVSDATATRYLSTLEKEGKIKQNKKTGKGVTYSKI